MSEKTSQIAESTKKKLKRKHFSTAFMVVAIRSKNRPIQMQV